MQEKQVLKISPMLTRVYHFLLTIPLTSSTKTVYKTSYFIHSSFIYIHVQFWLPKVIVLKDLIINALSIAISVSVSIMSLTKVPKKTQIGTFKQNLFNISVHIILHITQSAHLAETMPSCKFYLVT